MSDAAPEEVDPYWEEQGLPESCPECGESVNLYAKTHPGDRVAAESGDEVQLRSATVGCENCDHEWEWEKDDE